MVNRVPAYNKLDSPTKLLFIIDCYKNPYAGTEGQLLKLMSGLDKHVYRPALLLLRDSYYQQDNRFPVPVDILNIQGMLSPRSWLTLFRYLLGKRREGYRLAHTFFYDASMICPPILKILGYRVLVSRRDMGYWYTARNLRWLRVIRWFVDRVVVNSIAVKQVTVAKEGYPEKKVEVIYNGYADVPVRVDHPIGASNVDVPGFKVVIVANIRPVKRIQDAMHAMRLVCSAVPRALLYIIGDGDTSDLEAEANSLGMSASVRFLGSRSDVQELLPSFDVGILCSESEGFSNTLIEYMQAGLPVVCTDVGGSPEIVEPGINGFLYEVGNIDVLSEYLIKLARDPNMRSTMGIYGRDIAKQRYSITSMINSYQILYRSVM